MVNSSSKELSIQYLYEEKQGKNRALNCAISKAELGDIVVFTDDDVDVCPRWFIEISQVSSRWPKHSVFGGRIDVFYPHRNIPRLAFNDYIRALAFAEHNYSDRQCIYRGADQPFGPNYWVKREVFKDGRKLDLILMAWVM